MTQGGLVCTPSSGVDGADTDAVDGLRAGYELELRDEIDR